MRLGTIGFVLFTAAAVVCGVAHAITGGEKDIDGRFPEVGAIVVVDPAAADSLPPPLAAPFTWGTGTLIHPRVLLTAAHGTAPLEQLIDAGVTSLDGFRVSFAVNALDETTWLRVERIVTHPNYDGVSGESPDVAALILEEPVTSIEPARLPTAGFLDHLVREGLLGRGPDGGTALLVTGYGTQLEFPPPKRVRVDGYRRWATTEYQGLAGPWLVLNQNPTLDNGGAGFGDSGGPTYWTDPATGKRTLIAVTSWGDALSLSIDFHYRTDIADTLDFVGAVIDTIDN